MSNPTKPVWPDPGALPFSLFGNAASSPTSQAFAQPFAQGLAGGVDFMKKLWGQVPGNAAVPGFLLPTLDLDELDKRISDLKAAESWLEVNHNLLRATIQGLEVQRHTIAAIRSLGAMPAAPQSASSASPTPGGLPPGWPVAQANADARSAEVSPTREAPEVPSAASTEADRSATESEKDPPDTDASDAVERPTDTTKKAARKTTGSSTSPPPASETSSASALAGLTANNWLGYMQDQFAKVAQAALASSATVASNDARESEPVPKRKPPVKTSSKAAAKRRPAARKKPVAR